MRKSFVLLALGALSGCAQVESPPAPSVVADASVPVSAQPNVVVPSPTVKGTASIDPNGADQKGLRLYVDPATGEIRPPTEAELAAEAAARRPSTDAAVKAREPVSEIKLSNGMTEVQLGKQAEVAEVVCVLKDGSIGECPGNSASGLRAKPKP
jgi:hypothetical protein